VPTEFADPAPLPAYVVTVPLGVLRYILLVDPFAIYTLPLFATAIPFPYIIPAVVPLIVNTVANAGSGSVV
jgi:hypothetical protein